MNLGRRGVASILTTALGGCGAGRVVGLDPTASTDAECCSSGAATEAATTSSDAPARTRGPASGDGTYGGTDGGTTPDVPADSRQQVFVDVTADANLGGIIQVEPRVAPFCLLDRVYTEQPGDFCVAERLMAGVAAGDLDADGDPDLVFGAIDGGTRVMLNDGEGRFVDHTAASGIDAGWRTVGPALGDLDRDGDLDLYLTAFGGLRHTLWMNDGSGFFVEEALERGAAVASDAVHIGTTAAMGDVDRDGDLDMFVGEWRPDKEMGENAHHLALLRNLGPAAPGYFEDVTAASDIDLAALAPIVDAKAGVYVFSPAFVDLDGDDLLDLAIAADFGTSRLYWNRGDFTFEDGTVEAGVGTERNGMGSTFADLDADGDLDWFVSAIYTREFPTLGNRLYLNQGDRHFESVAQEWGLRDTGWAWGTVAFDHDNDGDFAIAIAAGWTNSEFEEDRFSVWDNDGSPPLVDIAASLGLDEVAQGRGVIALDYDRDGDLDLLVAHWGTPPRLYRNDDAPGDWLLVRTIGSVGDTEGRGAKLEVELEDGRRLVHQVGVGAHLYGHGESIAHFGLGDPLGPGIAAVRVHWPVSGALTEVLAPARNQVLVVVEPGS